LSLVMHHGRMLEYIGCGTSWTFDPCGDATAECLRFCCICSRTTEVRKCSVPRTYVCTNVHETTVFYVPPVLTLKGTVFCPRIVFMFRTILRRDCEYLPICPYSGDVIFSVIKFCIFSALHELRINLPHTANPRQAGGPGGGEVIRIKR
jgi:hypothetical protein